MGCLIRPGFTLPGKRGERPCKEGSNRKMIGNLPGFFALHLLPMVFSLRSLRSLR